MAKKKSTTLVQGDAKPPVQFVPMTLGDKAGVTKESITLAIEVVIHPDGKVTAAEGLTTTAANVSLMTEGLMPLERALIRVARAVKKELVGDVA